MLVGAPGGASAVTRPAPRRGARASRTAATALLVSAATSWWLYGWAVTTPPRTPSRAQLAVVRGAAALTGVLAVSLFGLRNALAAHLAMPDLQRLFTGAVFLVVGLLYALLPPQRDL